MKINRLVIFVIIISFPLLLAMIFQTWFYKEDDGLEIEKKWLVDANSIPYDLEKSDEYYIIQTYLSFSPEIRVRDINHGEKYIMTIKSNMSADGLIREETEYSLTKDEYMNLITKQEGNSICKKRYQLHNEDGDLIAIDIFEGHLSGLAYMEIEFDNEQEANKYQTPNWVKKDVTDDIRYKNGSLARYGIPLD